MDDWKTDLARFRDRLAGEPSKRGAAHGPERERTPSANDQRPPVELRNGPGAPRPSQPAFTPPGPTGGRGRDTPPPPKPREPTPAEITIGVDFGTRYTKVCYRFYGDPRSSVVGPKGNGEGGSLWLSRLLVDPTDGSVHAVRRGGADRLCELLYLKMRLKDPKAAEFWPHPRIERHLPAGMERGLAAFYLAHVIREAKRTIRDRETVRLRGRREVWQVNLSVPAQYQDDGVGALFREVGEVALAWSDEQSPASPPTSASLAAQYDRDLPAARSRQRVHVFAEIVAALHHFVQRPDTPDGVHGFLDIGGGTLDGCVFRLRRATTGPEVNVLAANVAHLGTIAVAKKAIKGLYQDLNTSIEQQIIVGEDDELRVRLPLGEAEEEIRRFISKLVDNARRRSSFGVLRQPSPGAERDPTRLHPQDRLVFRTCGGGSMSAWYRRTVEATHGVNNHAVHGIMPYSVGPLEPPGDFPAGASAPFARFVIAHGLSSPAEDLEAVRCRLPSQIAPGMKLAARAVAAPDYLSSKELV